MGLEEESSTDALATSWKIRNWSWRVINNKTKFWSPQKLKRQPNSCVGGFMLTACKLSIRITPLILTATSLREATLTRHWKGRFSVSTWFCAKEADISHGEETHPNVSSPGLYFTETWDSSSVAILLGAACWGGKQPVPSRWSETRSLACCRVVNS